MSNLRLNVTADTRPFLKRLKAAQKKQIPFASSKALNDTAAFVATNLNNDTTKYFDAPTPFTKRAFTIEKSSKRKLAAFVIARPKQEKYLKFQVFGGRRRPEGRALVLPAGIKLNQYGNIPRRAIKRLLGRPDTFSGRVRGVPGIWQRGHISKRGKFTASRRSRSTSVRLLVAYEPVARYDKRFPFERLFSSYVNRSFSVFFERSLANALRTAR